VPVVLPGLLVVLNPLHFAHAANSVVPTEVTNGDFEQPVVAPGTYQTFLAGNSGLTGWTIVAGQVHLFNKDYAGPLSRPQRQPFP